MKPAVSVMLHVDADALFKESPTNLQFCAENATFIHRDCCEFILHIGTDLDDETAQHMIGRMIEANCSLKFISSYKEAATLGVAYVVYYAG